MLFGIEGGRRQWPVGRKVLRIVEGVDGDGSVGGCAVDVQRLVVVEVTAVVLPAETASVCTQILVISVLNCFCFCHL